MPIVGHLAENGLVIYAEFRQGNVAPAARNLEFIKQCERQMQLHIKQCPACWQTSARSYITSQAGLCIIAGSFFLK